MHIKLFRDISVFILVSYVPIIHKLYICVCVCVCVCVCAHIYKERGKERANMANY